MISLRKAKRPRTSQLRLAGRELAVTPGIVRGFRQSFSRTTAILPSVTIEPCDSPSVRGEPLRDLLHPGIQ